MVPKGPYQKYIYNIIITYVQKHVNVIEIIDVQSDFHFI